MKRVKILFIGGSHSAPKLVFKHACVPTVEAGMKSVWRMLRGWCEWFNRRKPTNVALQRETIAEAERLDRLRDPEKYRGKE